MALELGQIVEGKYRIVRLIGEGGMGAVYEGENERIRRRVAIKVLHAGVAENTDVVARFQREAQAAGQIGSDHIVEVIDLGTLPDGDYFMVMEFLNGESLGHRLERVRRMNPRELAAIAIQLLEGLGAAHGAGIVHRDLKPDNVWLLASKAGIPDYVKILDFGISKFNALGGDAQMSMTRTGAVMGTPYYMAPEQAKGGRGLDQRSDLYSVGVILYEAVTGQVPFQADTFNELLFKIVLESARDPRELVPDLDAGFAELILKSMARDQNARFQSAHEFAVALAVWAGIPFDGQNIPPPAVIAEATTAGRMTGLPGTTPYNQQTPFPIANQQTPYPIANQQTPYPIANQQTPYPVQNQPTPYPHPQGTRPIADTNTPSPFSSTDAGATGAKKKSSMGPLIAVGAVALLVVGGIGVKLATGNGNASATSTPPAETAATAPAKVEPPPPASTAPPATQAPAATQAPPPPAASSAPAPEPPPVEAKKAKDGGGVKKGGGPAAPPPPDNGTSQTKGGRVFRDKL